MDSLLYKELVMYKADFYQWYYKAGNGGEKSGSLLAWIVEYHFFLTGLERRTC